MEEFIMTKTEFSERIAEKLDVSKKQANAFVDAFTNTLTEALKDGEKVTFTGFGTFEPSVVAEHEGVNPTTGERITIPEKVRAKFSAGKTLKDILNK